MRREAPSVWPLKYLATASPRALTAEVTWKIRPCCLLQWNLSWVKDRCVLSSFMTVVIIPFLLLAKLLIPRYDDSAVLIGGEVEPSVTKFATRSQPPEKNTVLSVNMFYFYMLLLLLIYRTFKPFFQKPVMIKLILCRSTCLLIDAKWDLTMVTTFSIKQWIISVVELRFSHE